MCHRGYLLDREMSDAELSFRGQDDYVSKYRRVLEYFDAVKIGLTATPALHTTDIFGDPSHRCSQRLRRRDRRLALERAKRARRRLAHPAALAGGRGHPSQDRRALR
jgi:type I site-specific restriction endonuclease